MASDAHFTHSLWTKLATVAGNINSDEAKMGGMTPAVFTYRGRKVVWPPYILRPTTRRAYCT